MAQSEKRQPGRRKHAKLSPERLPIVGLGASAGGIQALQTFFDNMPPDTGMSFVVVMHLSPDHESNLAQILQRHTALTMVQVAEPTRIEPNCVYVIPPNMHLIVHNGRLQLSEQQQPTGRRIVIDLFFRSLSQAYGPRAVAIVLSGTDSDGAIGIKHIKEQGGLTIAQDPSEAEFNSMPRSAIATGMIDWVLPVAAMPARLCDLLSNEEKLHVPPEEPEESGNGQGRDKNSGGPLTVPQVRDDSDESALLEVLHYLRSQLGHDFTHYKRATVLRRLARRLQVNLLENISAYLEFMKSNPAEAVALVHDLLISVTNFFRDSDAFTALEQHIPQLFAGKSASDQVRVWVAGCATGEEAYSIAILLAEHARRLETPPSVQVFATDLDDDVIQVGRAGSYSSSIEADVSEERLRTFFHKEQGRYRIRKEIRELILFSAHDLLKDSPFSRLDLISCRNLLIYIKREAQEAISAVFHFALKPGGLLFLGGSESLGDGHALFAPLDKHNRIYVRRSVPRPSWQIPVLPPAAQIRSNRPAASRPRYIAGFARTHVLEDSDVPTERRAIMLGDLHLSLLEQFAPPSVVINDNYDVLHLSEGAGRFLNFVAGEATTNLLKVVHPALRVELRTALFRATKDDDSVTIERIEIEYEGKARHLNVHVRPGKKLEAQERLILVVFELLPADSELPKSPAVSPEWVSHHLAEENQHLKDQLSSTIEQYEGSVEELKASNEELQAINEEMRSASEELETSKEELQSINEELTTVNQELKSNIDQLGRANSDLQNLMASTDIGTIFLDRSLRVKRFTPGVKAFFNLIDSDIGRPLSNITHKLTYPDLQADADSVLHDLRRTEREVRGQDQWFLVRLLPYRTVDDRIDGVVMNFIDITERKQAEEALAKAQANLDVALQAAEMGIWTVDLVTQETSTNLRHRQIFGHIDPAFVWQPDTTRERVVPDDQSKLDRAFAHALENGILDVQFRVKWDDGSIHWVYDRGHVVYDEAGKPLTLAGVSLDITERKEAEERRLRFERDATLRNERDRMGRELHDTLAQAFTAIKLQLDAAEQDLSDSPNLVLQKVVRAREIAMASLQEARLAIQALRSEHLSNAGLDTALERMVGLATTPLETTVRWQRKGRRYTIDPATENELYRIAQEALTNALRHAAAANITIELVYAARELRLRIADDGKGFDAANITVGFGLSGMRERAHRIGAELKITSARDSGTEISVVMPRRRQDTDHFPRKR